MMKKTYFLIGLMLLMLTGCFNQYTPPKQYQLTTFSQQQFATAPVKKTLLISQPLPVQTYQSSDMLYIDQSYQLEPFVRNNWTAPPAEMLFPLLAKSIQNTHYFSAVIPAPTFAYADWRLDSYVLKINQDFTHKPSVVTIEMDLTLIDNIQAKVIASKRFEVKVPAPEDTPYGGVSAANVACQQIMEQIAAWVVDVSRQNLNK